MGISLTLAEFVAGTNYQDIPKKVIDVQKKSVLDGIAITFGAATLGDGCRQMVKVAETLAAGGRGEATVIGFDEKLPAAWAAFANASMAHSLDYGDTHSSSIHSNSSTLPAALAAAEKLGNVDGKKLLAALVLGSEVASRLAYGAISVNTDRGFYMPTIFTAFAATTAVAKLMDLTPEEILYAWSFTLCQSTCSAELINSPKTCVRSVREAFAAKIAIVSCGMAKRGLIGFPEPFEGKAGFYYAYCGGVYDPEIIVKDLGKEFVADRLQFKAWPSCAGTHPSINGVLNLVRKYDIKPEEIKRIHVQTNRNNEMLLAPVEMRQNPQSSIIGKFSIPYTCAHAIIYGGVDLDSFSDDKLHDPRILELTHKFTYVSEGDSRQVTITIYTDRGEFQEIINNPYGSPQNPLSDEDFRKKIISCMSKARRPRTEAEADEIRNAVFSLDSAPDITGLMKLL